MTEPESCFSTTLPVIVFTRPQSNPGADWQAFDEGPGYFHIPGGHDVRVKIKNADDSLLAQLVEDLASCPQVVDLDLSENRKISDSGLTKLSRLPQLRRLNLSACDLADGATQNLTGFNHLQELDLSYCNRLTDQALRSIEKLRNLKQLNLQGCVKITRAGVAKLERPGLTIYKPSRGQKTRAGGK